jgi:hypothetical protein
MAVQTSFAQELTWSQNCNHRFLALLGNDGELDLAFLNVKNRVRDLSLRKNNLAIVFPSPTVARNNLGSNEALLLFLTEFPPQGLPFPPQNHGRAEKPQRDSKP